MVMHTYDAIADHKQEVSVDYTTNSRELTLHNETLSQNKIKQKING